MLNGSLRLYAEDFHALNVNLNVYTFNLERRSVKLKYYIQGMEI